MASKYYRLVEISDQAKRGVKRVYTEVLKPPLWARTSGEPKCAIDLSIIQKSLHYSTHRLLDKR